MAKGLTPFPAPGLRASHALSVEFMRSTARRAARTRTNYSYFGLEQDMLINPLEEFSFNDEDTILDNTSIRLPADLAGLFGGVASFGSSW